MNVHLKRWFYKIFTAHIYGRDSEAEGKHEFD